MAGSVLTVRWAHHGRFLASGSDDTVVMLWGLDPSASSPEFSSVRELTRTAMEGAASSGLTKSMWRIGRRSSGSSVTLRVSTPWT